jgi:hypothetical protein
MEWLTEERKANIANYTIGTLVVIAVLSALFMLLQLVIGLWGWALAVDGNTVVHFKLALAAFANAFLFAVMAAISIAIFDDLLEWI